MNAEEMSKLVDETSLERTTPTVLTLRASQAEDVDLQRMARPLRRSSVRSVGLVAAILGMTGLQRALFGTCQRSLTEIPAKPETDDYYAKRAAELRETRAKKKAENQRRADAGKRPSENKISYRRNTARLLRGGSAGEQEA